MGIWQMFNRSMASNEKEAWNGLKKNLLDLMTNNKGVLEELKPSNLMNIKKVIYYALCLCKKTVSDVMDNRKKQKKEIKKSSLVSQVNDNLSSFKVPDNFDPSKCIENVSSLPEVEFNLANCSAILSSLARLKPNKLSGWDDSIKKMMNYFYEISGKIADIEPKEKIVKKKIRSKQKKRKPIIVTRVKHKAKIKKAKNEDDVLNQNQKLERERKGNAANQSEEDKLKFRNEKDAKKEEELKKFNKKVEKLQKEYEEFYSRLQKEKEGSINAMRSTLAQWRKDHNADGLVKTPFEKKLNAFLEKENLKKQNEKENKEENSKNNEDNNQKHSEEVINEKPVTKKRKRKPSKKTFSDENEGNEKDDNYIEKMVSKNYDTLFGAYRLFLEGNKNNKKQQHQKSYKWPNELSKKCNDKFNKLPEELQKELKENVSEEKLRELLKKINENEYKSKIEK